MKTQQWKGQTETGYALRSLECFQHKRHLVSLQNSTLMWMYSLKPTKKGKGGEHLENLIHFWGGVSEVTRENAVVRILINKTNI